MVDAFTSRICNTGENTGDTLGGIPAVETGSLIDPFEVCTAPPPFGEAARIPFTPPSVASWLPPEQCIVREGEFADRPAAGCTDPCGCRFYWATDTQELWYDDCVEWVLINVCVVLEDTCADRPAAGCVQPCKYFYATDTGNLYFDDCDINEWVLLNPCLFKEGLEAARPATPTCNPTCAETPDACTFYWSTDTQQLWYADCDEDEWVLMNVCVVLEDEFANRPAAGCVQPCKFFYATDTQNIYFDDCDADEWVPVNPCVVLEDDVANIPDPGDTTCKFFWAIDTQTLYYNDGDADEWVEIGGGTFDENTALQIGTCADSEDMDEDKDAPTDCVDLAWDVTAQDPSEEGLILNMLTRIIYLTADDGGSEILYGFCRTLGFDTAGKLAAVSEECERSIIDTPEECE